MLVIRMQRTGRKGHAQFRVVVQDSRRTPSSGKIVASLGHFDPHSKQTVIDKEKVSFFLEHGAQPSDRVARLLKSEGVKLPDWVNVDTSQKRAVRNADKRRSTRPAAPEVEAPAEEAVAEVAEPAEAAAPEAALEATEAPAEEESQAAEATTEDTAETTEKA